ncbi:hypothetical protein [Gottfriedia acidiceleris]|uniref:Uncharacterized protein n=1 Tax=Gottfriedia acidiceleris TaxID=371036 RepID=A0ABY4JQL1_9BACI|nr:hypothetical protein [Gottfriedia acidiceleris]UPM56130.1 hypothetical protein MY490_09960 [Gottfriedia acidiceleris]
MIERERMHGLIDQLFDLRKEIQSSFIPEASKRHFSNAKKEILLGIRNIIDNKINIIESEEKENVTGKKIVIDD